MAYKRIRGNKWEFFVKRTGLLEKPIYLTFDTEAEGDAYCQRLEALLDRGIVPTAYQPENRRLTLGHLIESYLQDHAVKQKDRELLATLRASIDEVPLIRINVEWVDKLVTALKRQHHLAPGTIRAKVGALARCTDWGVRRGILILPDQPFRSLPAGYAAYTEDDAALSGGAREDMARERRLHPGEHERILEVIRGGTLARTQRPYAIVDKESVERLYLLALESAMRLSEMYTLGIDQVRLDRRTVFLSKTKNGDSRQVPLSSDALVILAAQLASASGSEVFPWWTPGGDRKMTSNFLSKLFANIFEQAQCGDLRFHDLRHEATSRLFERTRLSGEQIMKITGHRSHRMVMRYLSLRASDLAESLW